MKQAALPARSSPRTSSAQPSRSGQRCVGPAFPLNTECQQPATRSPTSLPSPSPTPPTPAHLPQCGSTPPSPTCLPPPAATAASRSTTCDPPPPSASWSCRRAPTPSLGTQWRPSTSRVRSPRAIPAKRAPPGGGRVGCPQLLFHMSTHALPMQQQPPALTPPISPPSPHPPPSAPPAAANEDCCLYTYDMRRLASASCVHQDFVSAVMDVDYSPTGREFVAGSYDRSGAWWRPGWGPEAI